MKKYFLALLTIIALLVSTGLYIYKGYAMDVTEYNKAMVPLKIEELGDILDMGWLPDYSSGKMEQLYILGQKEKGSVKTNTLYKVDIDKESIEVLYEYTPHPVLDEYLHLNMRFSGSYIVLLSIDSVVYLNYSADEGLADLVFHEPEYYHFSNYHRITSFANVYANFYTVSGERVLYSHNPHQSRGIFDMITNQGSRDVTKYLVVTDKVIASHMGTLYYTRKLGNNDRFYREYENGKAELVTDYFIDYTLADHPVILSQGRESFYLQYELFYVNEKKAISMNRDLLGYSPSFSAGIQDPQKSNKIIYTEFNEDGLGNVNLLTANTGKDHKWRWVTTTKEETLIENQPIVGKVILNDQGDKIIYFTLEEGEIRVKKYNIPFKEETDITGIFYKALQ